jgi:hypothetical protein
MLSLYCQQTINYLISLNIVIIAIASTGRLYLICQDSRLQSQQAREREINKKKLHVHCLPNGFRESPLIFYFEQKRVL